MYNLQVQLQLHLSFLSSNGTDRDYYLGDFFLIAIVEINKWK